MLNLAKLASQMRHAAFDFREEASLFDGRRALVRQTWNGALLQEASLVEKLLQAKDFPWGSARPLEPLNHRAALPDLAPQHIVLATDGSQIVPSRHEISPCYLVNIGRIRYLYGTGERPLQESEPFLYHREQDLYTQVRRQFVGVSEQWIGLERGLKEFEELAELCVETRRLWPERPVLAMIDGSLTGLLPELMALPQTLQMTAFKRLAGAFNQIRSQGIPLCAYISQSRRTEVINFLRLQRCPYERPTCETLCTEGQEPCSGLAPFPDRQLWQDILDLGERSPLFTPLATTPEPLQGHELCFFYLHCGAEVARIEIPRWVADRPEWLMAVHGYVFSQVEKGRGYPIALAEAHNQAVVKSSDRAQFYALLSRKLADAQIGIQVSRKELKKRRGIV